MTLITFIDGLYQALSTYVIPTILFLTLVAFLINVIRYFILQSGSEEGREKARIYIVWSMLGFVITIALWGIINLALTMIGITNFGGKVCPDYDPTCNPSSINVGTTPPTFPSGSGPTTPSAPGPLPGPTTPPTTPTTPTQPTTPSAPTPPPSAPGVTGGNYSNLGPAVAPTLQTPSGSDTFLSLQFSNITNNNVADDSRFGTALAFNQANIISTPDFNQIVDDTNAIRVDQGYQPLSLSQVPNPNPIYVQNLSTAHTNINSAQTTLSDFYQNNLGMSSDAAAAAANRDLDGMFNSSLPLDQRVENANATYNILTGTQAGLIARNTILTNFVNTTNAEINTSTLGPNATPLNGGVLITITDITG